MPFKDKIMKISKKRLTQVVTEELKKAQKEKHTMLKEKYDPYFTSDLQNLLRNVDSESIVQIIVNGQPVEIDEVWTDNKSNTLNISVR